MSVAELVIDLERLPVPDFEGLDVLVGVTVPVLLLVLVGVRVLVAAIVV